MRFLVDTQLLIWAAEGSRQLPKGAADLIADLNNQRLFSSLSIAETAIKFAQGRPSFQVDPVVLRLRSLANLYEELPLTGVHAACLADLPLIHKDPFDRLLVAQAISEGLTLLTADALLGQYGGRVLVV